MKTQASYLFSSDEMQILTSKFRVLSEESRIKILQILQSGEKSVSEIVEESGMLQANVSKQLKILLKGNIVNFRNVGKKHYYSISDNQVIKICKIICDS